MSKKVMVVMGGFSSEYEVSLVSGKGAAEALKKAGYDVVSHELNNVERFVDALRAEKPDVVFNALHGTFGEDGTIQGFLDLMQIPYTHSGLMSSAIGMNKPLTNKIAKFAGVSVCENQVLRAEEFLKEVENFEIPFVVKPVSEGSSVGVFVIKSKEDIKNISFKDKNCEVMVERFIDGKELTVMVLENKTYVVTELAPKVDFYDYEAKYTSGMTEHILPARISDSAASLCREFALRMHKALKCNTVSRSDFRYNEKDGVVFLEINTHPGMTPLSLVPEQAKYAGISYEKLCSILVENAQCKKMSS